MALTNIRKNARLYLPQMITGAGLTAMFYILVTLSMDERLHEVRGGSYLPTIMPLGTVVVAILSAILVLYTNSFLMKQRKREFGLYTVLGLEKRHVGRILFWLPDRRGLIPRKECGPHGAFPDPGQYTVQIPFCAVSSGNCWCTKSGWLTG